MIPGPFVPPYEPPPDRPGGTGREEHGWPFVPLALDDPGPIPTEPQVREPRPPRPILDPLLARAMVHRCSSEFCRHMHDVVFARDHRASARPLLTWALVVFLAGVLVGVTSHHITSHHITWSALSSAPSTVSLTSAIDGALVPAADRGADLVEARPRAQLGDVPRSAPSVPARANSHADDTPAAANDQPGATTHQPIALAPQSEAAPDRGDLLPATVVLGSGSSTSIEAPKPEPLHAVLLAIHRAAIEFGQDPGLFVGNVYCESSFDHAKRGAAGEIGALQFLPATFARYGRDLGYAPEDVDDLTAQARTAAYMWSIGEARQWSCWRSMQ